MDDTNTSTTIIAINETEFLEQLEEIENGSY